MYSKKELYQLRNEIPITVVIADVLDIPSKMIDGYFRFLCPLCSEFMTATNSKTNLARCFRCQKNFNPIDITMIVNKYTFKEAVGYLQDIREKVKARENQISRAMNQDAAHRSAGAEGGHPKSQI
ncbi:MAG: CHC2 zinc finger domain-containing protein [Desulfovermiculus sp.]|nr:CHC2 zinc finger domain-containing protein [Desulfovermiculus sp.]